MADQRFSSQAGPVNIMYELEDGIQRPPIPPKELETHTIPHENGVEYGYDSGQQHHHKQTGNVPTRSPSGNAPQVREYQQNSLNGIVSTPQTPISTSHSPRPSMGYVPPQETPPIGGHQSLAAASTVSPIESYRESYQTQPDSGLGIGDPSFTQTKYAGSEASYGNYSNAPAAPQYNTPVTGYYAPAQYNPNQSYGVGAAAYPPTQLPAPTKPEISYFGGPAPPAPPPTAPVAGAAGAMAAADGGKKKKKLCGLSVTAFSLLCVILFLIIAGAVLGGIFGSGALTKDNNNGDSSGSTEGPTSIVFPTSFPVPTDVISGPTTSDFTTIPSTTETPTPTTTSNSYAYIIPTGTWTVTGALTITTGTCINDLTATDYKEVWYCADNKTETLVVKDFSTTSKLMFAIDLDEPVRVRGLTGIPPTGPDTDKGESPFWTFSVQYSRQAFEEEGISCSVDVDLVFLLGRTKALFGFYEQVYAPKVCTLPHGGNSTAPISCGCGYL